MDGRLLGLSIVVFVLFAILQTTADNFYPLRYGKRENNEGRHRVGPTYDRRSDQNDLFYGSRYGKRSYNDTPSDLRRSDAALEMGNHYRRGSGIEEMKSGRYYLGPRFEYLPEAIPQEGAESITRRQEVACRYTALRHLFRCLTEPEDGGAADQIF